MKRNSNNWGHIAFVDKVNGQWVRLGGNQRARAGGPANAVSNYKYPSKVTALLWPVGIKSPE